MSKILIVEDNEMNRDMLSIRLEIKLFISLLILSLIHNPFELITARYLLSSEYLFLIS